MKSLSHICLLLFFAGALYSVSFPQDRTGISGLGSASLYLALLDQEAALRAREDSLNSMVSQTRSLFRTDPENRQVYSADILRLEGELFDVRNLLGIPAGRINTLEQQHIIKNLSDGSDPSPEDQQPQHEETSPQLVANPFFEENLPPEDYILLVEAQNREPAALAAINAFGENYSLIARIAHLMPLAENPSEADSLFREYEALAASNRHICEEIESHLTFIYDNKLYSYNYILDKLGRRSQLSSFERKTAEARDRAIAAGHGAESPQVAGYPAMKALLLDYEKTLANIAGYRKSADSLAGALTAISRMNLDFPAIELEEKLFLDYSDITFHTPAKYDSRNPIPQLAIHPKGEIYRILLGSFQKAQPVSILRGAYPVGVLQQEGRYEYFAGGFATLEDAAGAVELLSSRGFRDPRIARWKDGNLRIYTRQETDRILGNGETGLFRLSVDTGDSPFPEVVRQIIDDAAPGAEISRRGSLYIIGPMESRTEAAGLMEEILESAGGLTIKIEAIE
ncbi:MAG: hypothetical protein LUE10_05290 [Alistipes sp.]|nr:hypothetical protein [Alistipes sp.]